MTTAVTSECLDLGALLLSGKSPLPIVETRVRALKVGAFTDLLAPFEPTPLYQHLEQWGASHTVTREDNGFRIRVEKIAPPPDVPRYLDLRRLPHREPVAAAIAAYDGLLPGACLIVHLPHHPTVLTDLLGRKGIPWEDQPQSDGSCQIYMLKVDPSAAPCDCGSNPV